MTDYLAYRNLPYRITDGGIVPALILSLALKKDKSQWLMQVTAQVAYPFGHTKNTTVHANRRFASPSKPIFPAIQLRQETCIDVWDQCGSLQRKERNLQQAIRPQIPA
jgi:hypothetical protein